MIEVGSKVIRKAEKNKPWVDIGVVEKLDVFNFKTGTLGVLVRWPSGSRRSPTAVTSLLEVTPEMEQAISGAISGVLRGMQSKESTLSIR